MGKIGNYLITGGAGYIGSHTVVELLQAGADKVIVLDNFSNASMGVLHRIEKITGYAPQLIVGDICDRHCLDRVFSEHSIDAVIHFAGLKSVGDSIKLPLDYYQNNVTGSVTLFQAMEAAGVFKLIFSSSATVYGDPIVVPISEEHPTGKTTNPYGRSKLIVEEILRELTFADKRWSIGVLRYFNPVGAHTSGIIGENPSGKPNNLLPYITQVAVGRLKQLSVYGSDYSTQDGTGIRDYIHVVDLAKGHLAAMNYLNNNTGVYVWNLGTGRGYSVFEMIKAFEKTSGTKIPYQVVARRPGDVAECWSCPRKALEQLGWKAERSLQDIMEDALRWQLNNQIRYNT
jgi:UDP-glucose 4-epimerase